MAKHEEKYCPVCKRAFQCKVGNILQCQCSTVRLTADEAASIAAKYNDCLCADCMLTVKQDLASKAK